MMSTKFKTYENDQVQHKCDECREPIWDCDEEAFEEEGMCAKCLKKAHREYGDYRAEVRAGMYS